MQHRSASDQIPVIKPLGAQLYHRAVWVKVGDCNRVYKFNTFIGWVRYQNLNADEIQSALEKIAEKAKKTLTRKKCQTESTPKKAKPPSRYGQPWYQKILEKQRELDAARRKK